MKQCKCNHKTELNGVAEPYVMIDNRWEDLIELDFKCTKCLCKIKFKQ